MWSNTSPLPPLEVRGSEAKFPFGFHSTGLNGGLVVGNGTLPYSSQMQLREGNSYFLCFFVPWHFQFQSQERLPVICFAFIPKLISWEGARCCEHLAQTLRAVLPNWAFLAWWSWVAGLSWPWDSKTQDPEWPTSVQVPFSFSKYLEYVSYFTCHFDLK